MPSFLTSIPTQVPSQLPPQMGSTEGSQQNSSQSMPGLQLGMGGQFPPMMQIPQGGGFPLGYMMSQDQLRQAQQMQLQMPMVIPKNMPGMMQIPKSDGNDSNKK
jgi:hypothetical protein